MTMLDREKLLALRSPKFREVEVPDIGVIRIRELSGGRREELLTLFSERQRADGNYDQRGLRAWCFCASVCNGTGELLFDLEADRDAVEELPWEVLEAVFTEVLNFNALSEEAQEEAAKN